MPRVVTFEDYRPLRRLPPVVTPWIEVDVVESATLDGVGAVIETIALDPLDPDPKNPMLRSFSSDGALLEDAWYWLVWRDAQGNTSTSRAQRSTGEPALPIGPDDVRARSELIRTRYPAAPYDAQKEEDLANAIVTASSLLGSLTCRPWDATMPADLVPLAIQATVWKAEQLLHGGSMRRRTSTFGRRALKSMTAGPYSETYFGPDEARNSKSLDLDPEMHDLLWAIATEECRDRWTELWGGVPRPAVALTEVAWLSRSFGRY
jgi:hypothetical protein